MATHTFNLGPVTAYAIARASIDGVNLVDETTFANNIANANNVAMEAQTARDETLVAQDATEPECGRLLPGLHGRHRAAHFHRDAEGRIPEENQGESQVALLRPVRG